MPPLEVPPPFDHCGAPEFTIFPELVPQVNAVARPVTIDKRCIWLKASGWCKGHVSRLPIRAGTICRPSFAGLQ
jgi:hypothetical protein